MKSKGSALLFIVFILPLKSLTAEPELEVQPEDLRIEQSIEGGYHLWIRKKEGMGSVILTESSADPAKREHSYTLRNPEYHPVNGDERRILDGEFLDAEGLFFLMDSTPEPHPELAEAFHIFIPYIVVYGYPWSRSGEIQVLDGTFLNVRSFTRPYADYRGPYRDNPFELKVEQLPLEKEEGEYMDSAVESFSGIADRGGGKALRSPGKEDLVEKIGSLIDEAPGRSLDLVLCLDTTQSMHDNMPALKDKIVPLLREHTSGYKRFRLGLLYYRDFMEQYLVKPLPFVTDLASVQRHIDSVRVGGGKDLPEAVFEALYYGIHSYQWEAESRLIILIGDAPPHPRPRWKITEEIVYRDAAERGIKINTIILPP